VSNNLLALLSGGREMHMICTWSSWWYSHLLSLSS